MNNSFKRIYFEVPNILGVHHSLITEDSRKNKQNIDCVFLQKNRTCIVVVRSSDRKQKNRPCYEKMKTHPFSKEIEYCPEIYNENVIELLDRSSRYFVRSLE